MRRLALASGVFWLMAATPAVASGQSLVAGVAAGGGWDSNLSGSSGATPAAAGAYATATAWLGGALEPSSRDELSLEIGLDVTQYRVYADLDVQRPSAEVAWLHDFGDALTIRIGPSAGLIRAGDPARSGWDVGGTAAARLRLGERAALRLAAGYRHRAAEDEAFASDSLRGRGGVELDLWRDAALVATYTADVGDDTFYAPPPQPVAIASGAAWGGGGGGTGSGGRYGSPVSTFGTELVAYAASRVAHTGGARLSQRLGGGLVLEASYAYTVVLGEDQDYDVHLVTAELGWRR